MIHNSERAFQCPHCQKSFVQKNHLRYHLASKHGDSVNQTSHDCEFCDKKFAFPFQLKKHKEKIHQDAVSEHLKLHK